MESLTYTDLLPLSLPDQALKNIDIYVVHGPLGIGDPTHSSGAFKPRLCRMIRFTDVRAAMRLVRDGIRKPNFMVLI
jgi:hypothetical protein